VTLEIEGKRIGNGERPFLIAELSANHDGDLDQALALVEIAAAAGWDAFKLQTYTAESLTLNSCHPSLSIDPIWGKRNLFELYQSAAMPMEFHKPLFERARQLGLLPFTSIYDPRDMLFTEELGCSLYKIASFELTFDDLLIEVATTAKPIIISTGMAELDEVEHALEVLSRNGAGEVVLLHCISAYPTPFEEVNLSTMETLRSRFGRLVGFSDHTIGTRAAVIAAAMGAVAIEKHVTDDPSRKGPDHRFSATPDVMRSISEGVKDAWIARGNGEKGVSNSEQVSKTVGRRSAFALRDLKAGEIISKSDFRFVRPGAGIPPTDKNALLGRCLARDVSKGYPITYEDIAS
jgi:N-acetylneuraminate synthase